MTSALDDFAEFFKTRKTPVKRWYEDDVGRWSFVVEVDGTEFVCVARKTPPRGGSTSIMKRVAGHANSRDALVLVRLRDDIYVFDPVAVLADGTVDDVAQEKRRKRGEEWVEVPLRIACSFEEWYDGAASPDGYTDLGDF